MDDMNIEMKKIDESESDDVRPETFTKRRNWILKKAKEISLKCDANVSVIIMRSSSNMEMKLHEYVTPTTTMKNMIDQYQMAQGVDLWSSHYEQMQETLRSLMDENNALRREIMLRKGEVELNDLNMEQLCSLEDNMLKSLEIIRHSKYRNINICMDVSRKKARNSKDLQEHLLRDLEEKYEFPHGLVVNEQGGYYTAHAANNQQPTSSECQSEVTMEVNSPL